MNTRRYITTGLLFIVATISLVAKDNKNDSIPLIGNNIIIENKDVDLTPTMFSVSMDLNLTDLKLKSSRRVIITPIVKGANSNEEYLPQIVINGRRQDIEYKRKGHRSFDDDILEVKRKNGTEQIVHYSAVVPAQSWMTNYDVIFNEDKCGCGNILAENDVPVLSFRSPLVAFERPAPELKTRELTGSAYVDFPVDKITLYPEYHRNPSELQKIVSTIDEVKDDNNLTINHIDICGFASPESPYSHNAYLAENRAKTLKNYVRKLVNLEDGIFTVSSVPENWEGLRRYVETSNLEHKADILKIIDGNLEPDAKEAQIKKSYPADYAYMLSEYYPWLRRSDYTITYTVRPFSVEEAKEIFKTHPGQLSMEEMYLVAQTLEPESEEFHEIFETAVHLFPDDPTANLNAACIEIEKGDYATAEKHLEKAGESPYVWNAKGVIASKTGNAIEAKELFQKAADQGLETAKQNLENMNIEY